MLWFQEKRKFKTKEIHVVRYCTETDAQIELKTWNLLTNDFKISHTVNNFRSR